MLDRRVAGLSGTWGSRNAECGVQNARPPSASSLSYVRRTITSSEVMEAIEAKRHLPFAAILPVLILSGGLALRWILLTAGQHSAFRFLP